MSVDDIQNICLRKVGADFSFPFGESTMVFKVHGKMFALVNVSGSPLSINLKCDPEKSIELREKNSNIIPGYHMNKKYWITIIVDRALNIKFITELIDDSYNLVYNSLPKKTRDLQNQF